MFSKTISTPPLAIEKIKSGKPIPTKMSKIFEPNTFDVASVTSSFLAFATDITVSGIDVAAAVIVISFKN